MFLKRMLVSSLLTHRVLNNRSAVASQCEFHFLALKLKTKDIGSDYDESVLHFKSILNVQPSYINT